MAMRFREAFFWTSAMSPTAKPIYEAKVREISVHELEGC
jgi:hypothetical protein